MLVFTQHSLVKAIERLWSGLMQKSNVRLNAFLYI